MAESRKKPIDNGRNGRKKNGQFEKGHTYSQCKRHIEATEKSRALKKALINAVSEDDIKKIGQILIDKAKKGDIPAIKELFDRLWGRSPQSVEIGGEDGGPIPVSIVDYSKVDLDKIKDKSQG